MNAKVLDCHGKAVTMHMGCYGLGVTRVIAAAIEQNYDAQGIIWPESMAPFQIVLVALKIEKSEAVQKTTALLYQQLTEEGFDVLVDDRKASPGVKMADMDLIGIPHRLVISDRGLGNNTLEYKNRRSGETKDLSIDAVVEFFTHRCSKM